MKRHSVVALAALLILPQLAAAQSEGLWGPHIRITPFVGVGPGFKQVGEAFVFDGGGNVTLHDYEVRFASAFGMGVSGQFRFWNRFSVVGSAMWSTRGDTELVDFEDQVRYEIEGTNIYMAKAGFAVSMREVEQDLQLRRLNATLHVGPAVIHDRPKVEVWTPQAAAAAQTYPALNFGAEAEMPFSNGKMSFVLGAEDYMIFWDEAKARGRVEGWMQARDPNLMAVVEPQRSQMWMFRAGLTWRFF